MSKIVGIIPLQNYELIRNKIAEIIAIELENQFVMSYDPDFDCNVWLERTTPFDQTEMTPAVINVSFIDGNYQNEDVKDADGVYSYAVDVYSRGYTNEENIGDTRAALIVQKVIGKIRAILMATVYKTVDTGLGIVKNRKVVSVQVYDPKRHPQGDDSTTFDQAGRVLFQVTAIETVEVITPNMIMGADTWVRWCCTDKGYVWINDGQTNGSPGNPHVCPPIPPTPPLGPYLRTVSVDGVTITGNGTPSDPLVAIGGGGGGINSVTATAPLESSGGANPDISINQATTSTDGFLSSTDWDTFNNKQEEITLTTTGTSGAATLIGSTLNIPQYSGGGGGSILLQTDGVNNGSQSVLNLKEGSNITITDDGVGGVTITASGAGLPQVNSDWNATSGVAEILNKPTIPAAQIQSDWNQANNAAVDFIKNKPTLPTGTVTSVDLTMPAAFSVTGNPVTSSGTLAVAAAGLSSQYIRGDGQLANFPTSSGGGSSVNYYLNGSVAQGTLGGVAFKQMSGTPVIGAGTDFTINADGYIQSFITDASVPNQLAIPAGNWNFEMYFSANSGGGSPRFYIELYKLSAGTLTLIASSVANPEFITNGTQVDLYTTAVAVPSTVLLAADRLAIRVYVIHSSKTITLHTENSNLCQVITTFSTGINALNGLTAQVQSLAVGTSGTDFAISSSTDTHTFNLPTASATNRGALSSANWSTFNGKQDALVSGTNIKTINGSSVLGSGNIATPFELVVAASDEGTALTTGTAKITFRMPRAVTLTSVRASLTTAQGSGSIFTVDINENGTSILSTKLTIDNTEKTSFTAATPPVISDAALADDAEITIDIDQIGDGTAKGLKVMLIGTVA